MLLQIAGVVAPVFLIVTLGLMWARQGMPFDMPTIGSLVLRIGTPCLIFSTLTRAEIALDAVGIMVLTAVCVIAVSALVGAIVLHLARLPLHTYLLIAMHGNSGNMGLPLAAMVFGAEGLALAIAYFTVVSISQNTLGLLISGGKLDLPSLLAQPVRHASALTVLVMLTGVTVPLWIARTTELLAGLVIPAMLLLLGVALNRLKVADLRIAAAMSGMRFAAGATGAAAAVIGFGLTGPAAGVTWIMATMPAAVINVIFAERFARSPERVAGAIVVSTLASLAGLPLIVWAALWVSGQ